MMTRVAKLSLLAALALYYTLVVFNNLTDFGSNAQFVRHVLTMDTTFPGNHGLWRAITSPAIQLAFYWSIIFWEFITTVLLWLGVVRLYRALHHSAPAFNAIKRIPLLALTLSMLMWLVAFMTIGGEWFLMWQSHVWDGRQEAFRMFVVAGIVLLIFMQPETVTQP